MLRRAEMTSKRQTAIALASVAVHAGLLLLLSAAPEPVLLEPDAPGWATIEIVPWRGNAVAEPPGPSTAMPVPATAPIGVATSPELVNPIETSSPQESPPPNRVPRPRGPTTEPAAVPGEPAVPPASRPSATGRPPLRECAGPSRPP